MKKLFALLLALSMLLVLAACGSSAPDPNCGVYMGETVEAYGITMSAAETFGEGFSIELKDGGRAVLTYNGDTQNLKWTLNGTSFHAEGGGESLNGTLINGVLTLPNMLGTGMTVTFVNHALARPAADDTETLAEDYSWWEGRWYGWGVFSLATGTFAEFQDKGWDVTGEINVSGNSGAVTLWDITTPDTVELTAAVRFAPGLTAAGAMTCVQGSFLDDTLLFADGEWTADPGATAEGRLEHTFLLRFSYESDEGDFEVCYVLRPWGMLWDDVRSANTADMLYDDMMPFHYEDWYLPQLNGHPTAELPAVGTDSADLLGRWAHASGYTYEFLADGTGSYSYNGAQMDFTYTVEGDQLSILYNGSTSPFVTTYRIDGSTLIILDSLGSEVEYAKQ